MLRSSARLLRRGNVSSILRSFHCHLRYDASLTCRSPGNQRDVWIPPRRILCTNAAVPLAAVPTLSEIPDEYLRQLSAFCQHVMKSRSLSERDVQVRIDAIQLLETRLRAVFPDAQLKPFGSTKSGLAMDNCDLDVCFLARSTDKLPAAVVMKRIAAVLSNDFSDAYSEITCIAHDRIRVPLCKLRIRNCGVSVDISSSNKLALLNSELLKTYSEVDSRFTPLAIMFKSLAKGCNIADVRSGSLSSYAYVMMLVYFLQRTDPPVLPNLQRVFKESNEQQACPERIFEGHNTYFFDDIKSLPDIWDGYGKNKQSVGELWLQLLKFYAEFDYKSVVISPRLPGSVSARNHPLISKKGSIIIEDPFDLSHNLGRQVYSMTLLFLRAVFASSYDHFAQVASGSFFDLERHYFSVHYLTGRSQLKTPLKNCVHCGAVEDHFSWDCSNSGNTPSEAACSDLEKLTKERNVMPPKYYSRARTVDDYTAYYGRVDVGDEQFSTGFSYVTKQQAHGGAARLALNSLLHRNSSQL